MITRRGQLLILIENIFLVQYIIGIQGHKVKKNSVSK